MTFRDGEDEVSPLLGILREEDPERYRKWVDGDEGADGFGAERPFASFFEVQERPEKSLSFDDFTEGRVPCGERMRGLLSAVSLPEQAAMEIALDILDPLQVPGACLSKVEVRQFLAIMGVVIERSCLEELLKETWGWARGGRFFLQDLLQVYTWWRGVSSVRLPPPPVVVGLYAENSCQLDDAHGARGSVAPIVGYDEEVAAQLLQKGTKSVVDELHDELANRLGFSDTVPDDLRSERDRETNVAVGLPWFKGDKIWLCDDQYRVMLSSIMVVVALAYFFATMNRNASFAREFSWGWLSVDIVLTLLYTFDVFMWMHTAFLDLKTGLLVEHPQLIRQAYLRGWFVVDVLACLPVDVFFYCLATSVDDGSSTRLGLQILSGVCNHLRVLKSIRLFYAFRITGHVRFTKFYLLFFSNYLPILMEVTFMLYMIATFAMFFVMTKYVNGTLDALGEYPFVTAIYFVVQTATTVGYGDVDFGDSNELAFLIVLMAVSLVWNGVAIGRLMGLVMRPTVASIRQDNLRQLLAVLQFFRIPIPLQIEILNFQGHVLWTDLSSTFENQLAPLPLPIRENIETVRRVRVLFTVPLFCPLHDSVVVSLASRMVWRTFRPEEYISYAGEPHGGIRFVMFGFVDVLESSGHYVRTIKKGDVFGSRGLFERGALSGSSAFPLRTQHHSYKSISYADLYVLTPEALFQVAVEFPRFGDCFSFDTIDDKSILLSKKEAVMPLESAEGPAAILREKEPSPPQPLSQKKVSFLPSDPQDDGLVSGESVVALRQLIDGLMEDLNASIQDEENRSRQLPTFP